MELSVPFSVKRLRKVLIKLAKNSEDVSEYISDRIYENHNSEIPAKMVRESIVKVIQTHKFPSDSQNKLKI